MVLVGGWWLVVGGRVSKDLNSSSKRYAGVFLSCCLSSIESERLMLILVVLARYAGVFLLPWTLYGLGTKYRCLPVSLTRLGLDGDGPRGCIVHGTMELCWWQLNRWHLLIPEERSIIEGRRLAQHREDSRSHKVVSSSVSHVWGHVFLGGGECKDLSNSLEWLECGQWIWT